MKKLKLNKKTVANLSKSSIGEVYGGASDTQCISENTCTAPYTADCPTSNFLACQSIAGTVCPASNDIRCHTQGCTIQPMSDKCTNICK